MAMISPYAQNMLLNVYPLINEYIKNSEVFKLYAEILSSIHSYSSSVQFNVLKSIEDLTKITRSNSQSTKSIHELKSSVVNSITKVIDSLASLLITKDKNLNDEANVALEAAKNLILSTFTQRAMISDNNVGDLSRTLTYFIFLSIDEGYKKGFTHKQFDDEITQGIAPERVSSLMKRLNAPQHHPKNPKPNPSNNISIRGN